MIFFSGGEDGLVCVWRLSHLAIANYMYLGIVSSESSKSQVTPRYTFSDHSIKITDLYVGIGELRARLFTASDDKTCKVSFSSLLQTYLCKIRMRNISSENIYQ